MATSGSKPACKRVDGQGYDYIHKRGKRYVYRRGIPEDVRPYVANKREWFVSLRTDRLHVAERRALSLAAEHERVIDDVRSGKTPAEADARRFLDGPEEDIFKTLAFYVEDFGDDRDRWPLNARMWAAAIENGGVVPRPSPLPLRAAYEADRDAHRAVVGAKKGARPRHETPIETAVDDFVKTVGDLDVREIDRSHVKDYIAALRTGIRRANGKRQRASESTVRRRVGALSALFGRAYLEHGIDRKNPFSLKDHDIGGTAKATDRLPLNRAMVDALREHLSTSKRVRNETRRILTIMMATGADVGEIGGAVRGDFVLDHETPHLWIRPNRLRGLKAEARERRVPLVGDALVAATEAVRGLHRPKEQVFEGYDYWGRGGDSMSAKLNKVLRAAGIPKSPRLTAKSLRHSVAEALRAAGAPEHVNRRILGHAASDPHARYGTPSERLSEAQKWLEAAVDRLGEIDDLVYGPRERMKATH